MDLPQHWRTEKPGSVEIGHMLINFFNRISSGAISDQWAFAIRTELANTVMNLARVFATSSLSSESVASTSASTQSSMSFTSRTALCLKTVQFWLAVAALGMINDASWLELSSTWRSLKVQQGLFVVNSVFSPEEAKNRIGYVKIMMMDRPWLNIDVKHAN